MAKILMSCNCGTQEDFDRIFDRTGFLHKAHKINNAQVYWNSECNKLILVAPREWCDYLTDKRQDIPE